MVKVIIILAVIFVGVVGARSYPENWRYKNPWDRPSTVPMQPRFKRGYYDFQSGRYQETNASPERIGLINDRSREYSNQYNYNRGDYSPERYNTGGYPAQSSFEESRDYGQRNRFQNSGMGNYDSGNRGYLSSYSP